MQVINAPAHHIILRPFDSITFHRLRRDFVVLSASRGRRAVAKFPTVGIFEVGRHTTMFLIGNYLEGPFT